ncbi:lipid II flippase MurJ [Thermoflexus sp.]|uniref:lipid II flippase MurJ n=1 Tax=Thermoflexus sp. TaxID=1969742 RepID=UPI002ADE88DE|nr:lipid II flippase MurJ [Thermoflexus sp.]
MSEELREFFRRIVRPAAMVAGLGLLGKLTGFLAQVVVAARFGTGPDKSAFDVAMVMPDFLFLFTGGTLAVVLVPVLTAWSVRDPHEAARLATTVVVLTAGMLTAAGLLIAWSAPFWVRQVFGPGLPPPAQEQAIRLLQVLWLVAVLFGLSGALTAVLHTARRFVWPAMGSVLADAGPILGALLLAHPLGILGLAWGVILGALFHTLILLPGLRGWSWTWAVDPRHPGLRTVGALLIPRALIVSLAYFQIAWGYRLIGGLEPGAVAALAYGWRLMQVPQTLISTSLAIVLLPTLSAHVARGDREALRRDLGWALGIAGALSVLAGGVLGFGGETLVRWLLARGAFGEASVEAVGAALRMFAPGLLTYTMAELAARAFYARHDFLRPLAAAAAGVAAYLAMAPALVHTFGASGPALANSLAIGLEALLLLLWLRSVK